MKRLAAVAAAALLLALAPAWAGEVKHDDALKAAQKGAGFLAKQQNPDGSFGSTKGPLVGYTGLVVTALLESGTAPGGKDGALVKKALEFILGQKQPDGSIGMKQLGYMSYETSIAIMALTAVDKEKYKAEIKKAADYLMGIQDDGSKTPTSKGGIGYGSDKTNSNLSTTHYALQALKDAGVPEDSPVWKNAVAFVAACQNNSETNTAEWAAAANDGGFIYSPKPESKAGAVEVRGKKGWRSYASMTYAGYLSYVYAKLGNEDPRVKAALKWISENYGLDDNPGLGNQGLYYYYLTFATAMAARGEPGIKDKDGKEHLWAPELAAKLISHQDEDGSWLNKADRWEEGDKIICTAYSVRALGKALKFMKAEEVKKDPSASAVDRAL